MLTEIKTIADLKKVADIDAYKGIALEDLLPQKQTFTLFGGMETVELTAHVYFDEDTKELVRPRVVTASEDDITFIMKEVWIDEELMWLTEDIFNWHYGMPDENEWSWLPINEIKKELYRVSLNTDCTEFVAYVKAVDEKDAYKKGSEIIADDYAQCFLTEDRKTVEELEDLYYSFRVEEVIPGDHFTN